MTALMNFTSHIAGKNAQVAIYPDRIEWERAGRITATRVLTGAALVGKARKGGSTEMIFTKAITSVTTKKDGFTNWAVQIIAPGNSIEMRCSKAEAEQVKATLLQLMANA